MPAHRKHNSEEEFLEATRLASREAARRRRIKEPWRAMLTNTAMRARKLGLPYELDEEWLREAILPMTCSVTGLPLSFNKDHGFKSNPWAPSIDRVKPLLGYTKSNSRIVCWAYNVAKFDWDDQTVQTLTQALLARGAV